MTALVEAFSSAKLLTDDALDLSRFRETPGGLLGEDELAFEGHLEGAPTALLKCGLQSKLFLNFVRQTGGLGSVVSNHAVFD